MKPSTQTAAKSTSKSGTRKARTQRKETIQTPKSLGGQISDSVSESMDTVMKMERSTLVWGLAGAATIGAGAYLLYRSWSSGKLSALFQAAEDAVMGAADESDVSEKLPLGVSHKKPSPSIRDEEGNYDMDGVSYDVQGVIVSSDNNKELSSNI